MSLDFKEAQFIVKLDKFIKESKTGPSISNISKQN